MSEHQSWEKMLAEAEAHAYFAQALHDQAKANLDSADEVLERVEKKIREFWWLLAVTTLELVAVILIVVHR